MRTLPRDLFGGAARALDDRPMLQLGMALAALGVAPAPLPAPRPALDPMEAAARAHGERMGWAFVELVTRPGIGCTARFARYADGNGRTWERSEAQLCAVAL